MLTCFLYFYFQIILPIKFKGEKRVNAWLPFLSFLHGFARESIFILSWVYLGAWGQIVLHNYKLMVNYKCVYSNFYVK